MATLTTNIDDSALRTYADNAASTAVSGHVAAADPHTQYQKESEKGQPNGYASLDASGQVPVAQIPDRVQTVTVILDEPVDGTYFLYRFQGAATVLGYQIKCATGNFDATVKINSTAVTGLDTNTTTSSYASYTASGANTASSGNELNLVISSSSTPADGRVIITYKETI